MTLSAQARPAIFGTGFEEAPESEKQIVPGCLPWGKANSVPQRVEDAAQARSGQFALRFASEEGKAPAAAMFQRIPLPPEADEFLVTLWVKGTPGTLYRVNSQFAKSYVQGTRRIETEGWHQVALPIARQSNRDFFRLTITLVDPDANASPIGTNISDPQLWVDDMVVGYADVRLNRSLGDHMVLQRDRPIVLWGEAPADTEVTVQLADQSQTVQADGDGHWKAEFDPMSAGGPHEIRLSGTPKVYGDVMVGDVWVCAGQSNMMFGVRFLNGVFNQEVPKEIQGVSDPNLRIWTAGAEISDKPRRDFSDLIQQRDGFQASRRRYRDWSRVDEESLLAGGGFGGFSAVGYYFGKRLHEETGVPIGLLEVARGGTAIEAWMSPGAIREGKSLGLEWVVSPISSVLEERPNALTDYDVQKSSDFNTLSTAYLSVLHPILPMQVRGVLWYQGENNAFCADRQYAEKLQLFMKDWRESFGQQDLPIYVAQLPNYRSMSPTAQAKIRWQFIREAQLQTTRKVPDTGLAVTLDLADPDMPTEIHPYNKQPVGERLAQLALVDVYGQPGPRSGPVYETMQAEGGSIRLTFDQAGEGLATTDGELLRGFTIAEEGGPFVPAQAAIDGDAVVVRSDQVASPVAVRYCFDSFIDPVGNLTNETGIPATPFRTDSRDVP